MAIPQTKILFIYGELKEVEGGTSLVISLILTVGCQKSRASNVRSTVRNWSEELVNESRPSLWRALGGQPFMKPSHNKPDALDEWLDTTRPKVLRGLLAMFVPASPFVGTRCSGAIAPRIVKPQPKGLSPGGLGGIPIYSLLYP